MDALVAITFVLVKLAMTAAALLSVWLLAIIIPAELELWRGGRAPERRVGSHDRRAAANRL